MTEAAPRRWTVEEFFAWQERQPERYELVDGIPVRMMAGGKNVHDDIVVNVLAESSSTCWRRCAISSEVEAVGRSQATEVSRQNLDRSAVPTSASTADAGTPTQLRQHLLASSWRFSPQPRGTSTQSQA